MNGLFPEDPAERKTYPVYSGLLRYFPSALAAVANHSHNGNEKHNPGQELHHDRAKSGDEADALVRHLMEGDLVGMAWRALAMLQKHCEANGAPIAPAARNAFEPVQAGGCAPPVHASPAITRGEKIAYDMATDRPSAEGLTTTIIKQHPMAAEALRDQPGDRL